ncbi:MAG: insulinase family protein [Armatimonadetes bacterium]|nr:insulinase family protein [Armatimonadota bacterium]
MTIFRRFYIALLLLMAVSAFAAENAVTETVLPNGLTVLIKEVHSAPVLTVQVWYKVGSRNEHTGITGTSHLLEHMMFKGTEEYGKGEFQRLVKSKGGRNNASTSNDFTNYWELLSTEHLELALKLEADRMTNALIDAKELDAEKVVVRSELEWRENDPEMLLYTSMDSAAYTAHPYRWPIIGWTADVMNVPREKVYNYYRTFYHPNNATLVIVGDVDIEKTMALVRNYFGVIPKGPEPPPVYTEEPPQRGERRFALKREGSAARTMVGFHVPELTDPDTYPIMVLDQILSGGKSSRLYQSLVEGQIATSVWSTSGSSRDPGLFLLAATGRDGVTAEQLEKALVEEVEKAASAPPSPDELTRAKNQLEAYLIFQNDGVSRQGYQLGYYNTLASWKYLDTLLPRLNAVTAEEVQRVAKQYMTEDNRTVGWFVPTGPTAGGQGDSSMPGAPHFSEQIAANYRSESDRMPSAVPFRSNTVIASNNTQPVAASDDPASSSTSPKAAKPKRVVLGNGMVVIVQENPSNRTIAISGNLKAGGYFDPTNKQGLAKFVAGMLSRGTQSRTALDIAKETDFVGANINISSSTEAVEVSAKALSKDFGLMLDLISDQLRNPTFPDEQIEKLRGEMVSELEQEKENTELRARRALYRSIYPKGHPYYSQTIEEDQASIKSIAKDDLVAFHKKYYGPETTVIVIVGDVEADQAVSAVEKQFGNWQPTGPARKIDIPDVALASEPSKVVIPVMDKSQADVFFGHAGQLSRDDPDFYTVNVMNYVLGGGGALDSRLGSRIRDDMGLVYSVYSWFEATLGEGPWYAAFGANPENVDKAVAATDEEIRRYINSGPTEEEFKGAIDYIVGVFPIRLERNDGVASVLLSAEFYGLGMDYIQEYPKLYRAVTINQVRAAAKKYLHPDRRTLVIAGPYK